MSPLLLLALGVGAYMLLRPQAPDDKPDAGGPSGSPSADATFTETPAGAPPQPNAPWMDDVIMQMFARDHALAKGEVQPADPGNAVPRMAAKYAVPAKWAAALWGAATGMTLTQREAAVDAAVAQIRPAMLIIGPINDNNPVVMQEYVQAVLQQAAALAGG